MSRRTMSVAQHAAAFLVSVIVSGRGLHFYHNRDYCRWPSVGRLPIRKGYPCDLVSRLGFH